MQVANYSEFRKNVKACLDKVSENNEPLIIHRSGGKSVVVISVDEYNSMDETEYLTSTKANTDSMNQMLEEYGRGDFRKMPLEQSNEKENH